MRVLGGHYLWRLGIGFRIQGLGFMVQDLGCWALGLGDCFCCYREYTGVWDILGRIRIRVEM